MSRTLRGVAGDVVEALAWTAALFAWGTIALVGTVLAAVVCVAPFWAMWWFVS